jgi:hypothetical protein
MLFHPKLNSRFPSSFWRNSPNKFAKLLLEIQPNYWFPISIVSGRVGICGSHSKTRIPKTVVSSIPPESVITAAKLFFYQIHKIQITLRFNKY